MKYFICFMITAFTCLVGSSQASSNSAITSSASSSSSSSSVVSTPSTSTSVTITTTVTAPTSILPTSSSLSTSLLTPLLSNNTTTSELNKSVVNISRVPSLTLSPSLEKDEKSKKEKRILRILSIDGGGIRGVIPATLLKALEEQTGHRVSEMFHMIAGTSTGGILALGYATPDKIKDSNKEMEVKEKLISRPNSKFSSEELGKLYEDHGGQIFTTIKKNFWGLFGAKYATTPLRNLLTQKLDKAKLSDSLVDVIVTSYDTERRHPHLFKSWMAKKDSKYDFLMRDVGLATSAAPTYFKPVNVENKPLFEKDKRDRYSLIDGGLCANNPTMCALTEAYKRYIGGPDLRNIDEIMVVSIGTGAARRPIFHAQAQSYGLIGWAKKPLFDILLDSTIVDHQARVMLPERNGLQRYYRFQPVLDDDNEAMDNYSANNINTLRYKAEEMTGSHDFQNLCKYLKDTPKCDIQPL